MLTFILADNTQRTVLYKTKIEMLGVEVLGITILSHYGSVYRQSREVRSEDTFIAHVKYAELR
jgi:hypothetical protein